jgi:hypothetical protein
MQVSSLTCCTAVHVYNSHKFTITCGTGSRVEAGVQWAGLMLDNGTD